MKCIGSSHNTLCIQLHSLAGEIREMNEAAQARLDDLEGK